jgi:hypothetical protein
MSRKPSEIWTHYVKKDNSPVLAECKYCKQTISYKSTTGNLGSHLKRSHASVYLAQKTNNSGSDCEVTQQTRTVEQDLPSTSRDTSASEVAGTTTSIETSKNQENTIIEVYNRL